MKTLIMYYSLSGSTRNLANKMKSESEGNELDSVEVKEKRKRNIITAFIPGCPQAMHRKKVEIQPVDCKMGDYEKFVLAAPIWAGFPAPAFNSMAELVPCGSCVDVIVTSGSGDSSKSKESTLKYLADLGLRVENYTDINTAKK